MVARIQRPQHGGNCGTPGREDNGIATYFERSHCRLKPVPVGISLARIEIASVVAAVRIPLEGHRHRDGLNDGAGAFVHANPAMYGTSLKSHLKALLLVKKVGYEVFCRAK
jgi:hypothetical protein